MRTLLQFTSVLILAASATAAQAACSLSAPIVNVNDALVAPPANKAVSAEGVRAAIVRADASMGWQLQEDGPGTLVLRAHPALVDIPYSATTFSFTYKSSIELDEADGQIHKNYNVWISNLKNGIFAQLLLV